MKRATRKAKEAKPMASQIISVEELLPRDSAIADCGCHHNKDSEPPVKHWFAKGRLKLYKYEEVEHYLQDNDCILTGYRQKLTYHESFLSLFHFHNEWCNVWSHFLGFVIFI
jgi:hypothetical protein